MEARRKAEVARYPSNWARELLYVTVRVAALVVAEPIGLVNLARNCQPFANGMAVPLRLGDVQPATSNHVEPWSTESCHCTDGAVSVLAAAVKVKF